MHCCDPLVSFLGPTHRAKLRTDPVLHMLGLASPWLETDSNDSKVAEVSAKVSRITFVADL